MTYSNHPWIEGGLDAEEFEAVMVVTNKNLPGWDNNAVTRAFQTFLWTTVPSGNRDRTSFVHDDTGVIVCYDGNVVGIECGHGSLSEALPDLISVLHSLGWENVTVYALQRQQEAVMDDIARSIPAQIPFEISPGERGFSTPIGEVPEARSMVEHTRALMELGVEQSTLQETFQSLAQDAEVTRQPALILDDEESLEEGDGEVYLAPGVAQFSPAAVQPQEHGYGSHDVGEAPEEPRVFELVANSDIPQSSTSVGSTTPALKAVSTTSAPGNVRVRPITPPPPSSIPSNPERQKPQVSPSCEFNIIPVGQALFFFPADNDDEAGEEELQQLAKEHGILPKDIYHLRPGVKAPDWRWDLLGEVDPEYPGFADFLASTVLGNGMFAGPMLHAVETGGSLLSIGQPTDLAQKSPGDEGLIKRANVLFGSASHFLAVDKDSASHRAFSVRKIMIEQQRAIYRIHVDTMDGPFVHQLVAGLRAVVFALGKSGWLQNKIAPQPEPELVPEMPAPTAGPVLTPEMVAALAQLTPLLQSLQSAGGPLPSHG